MGLGRRLRGVVPVSERVVIDSLTVIDPSLEKIEGICVVGNHIVITYHNGFNVWEVASTPASPNPNGPLVQLELIGANHAKFYVPPLH